MEHRVVSRRGGHAKRGVNRTGCLRGRSGVIDHDVAACLVDLHRNGVGAVGDDAVTFHIVGKAVDPIGNGFEFGAHAALRIEQ